MELNITRTPYSRRGSYFAISPRGEQKSLPAGLYLRSVHGYARPTELLLIEVWDGSSPLPYRIEADEACVRMISAAGAVELCLADKDVLRIRSRGIGFRVSRSQPSWGECAMPAPDGRWELNSHMQRMRCMFHPLQGAMQVDTEWKNPGMPRFAVTWQPGPDGVAEAAIEEFDRGWKPRAITSAFDADAQRLREEFDQWVRISPAVAPAFAAEFESTRRHAAYLNWSSIVPPAGNLKRTGMYMSKNVMTGIWSWDNCFNAMATAGMDPDLAWDQFMIPFDHQDADGCLPDVMTDNIQLWAFNKPPIQGWVLRQFEKVPGMLTDARAREIYEPLARWTNWWFAFRDYDGDGVPQYNHGNDSGWDNATLFDHGLPVESPDLMAFLALQQEMLATLATRIGRAAEAAAWMEGSRKTIERMVAHSWRGDRFVAPRSGDHAIADQSDCLLNFLPIVLGNRLPGDVRGRLVAALKDEGRFLAPTGFATESLRSSQYDPKGYWRGPVWAPTTLILLSGLRECGETQLTREVALRFCRACAKSGFAENFDAQTGESRNDSAYTWTSSVFLMLAAGWLEE